MIQQITNQGQNLENAGVIAAGKSGCCGADNSPCEYSLTYTQSNAVQTLTISENGSNRALPLTAASTSAADVRTAILNALNTAGYREDGDGTVGVVVLDLGSTLSVAITGNITCVNLIHAGGTAAFTAKCTEIGLRNLQFTGWVGGASGVTNTTVFVDGVGSNLGAITPGSTTVAAVKAAIEAALTALGTIGTVTATLVGGASFTVDIAGTDCSKVIQLGTAGPNSATACVQDWV